MSSPGTIRFGQVATKPSPPPVDYDLIYVKTDDVLYIQDSAGVETPIGTASGITSLSGDVTASGPGAATATVNSVGGVSAANVALGANAANAATSSNTPSTIVMRNASGNFSAGTITASLNGNATSATTATTATNFTGSLSGDVTGTQGATVVSLVGGQTASAVASATVEVQNATSSNTPGTLVERDGSGNFSASTITAMLIGNVNGNVSGSSASFTGSLSGDVTGTQSATVILSTVVTGKVLTGYSIGPNTPILSTDSILQGFEKLQGQVSASIGSAITALTGDGTATGPGSVPFTLATVNSNVGTFGSSTSIPSFTVNAKGLITAASGNAVVAPAGTLTGTTLASNVVTSSLTAVGTIGTGTWNGSTIGILYGGTGQTTAAAAFAALSPLTNAGDLIYENSVPAPTNLAIGTTGQVLTVVAGLPSWQNPATNGTVTSVALSLPSIFTVTGSPVTTSGTLTGTLTTQSDNTVFAGPVSGGAATPTFRLLVSADIPNNAANTTGTASNITSASNTTLTSLPDLTSASSLIISGSQITGFTQGSVLFAGASGQITQDNPNFYWNDSTLNLGLGLIPGTNIALDLLNSSGASKAIQTTSYGTGSSIPFRGRFARGTVGTPAAAQAGDNLSVLSGRGYGTSQFATASTGALNIVAGETFTNTSNATYLQFEVTPTGSVTIAEAMRLNSTGNLLIGTTTDTGQKLQVTGTAIFSNTVTDTVAPIFSSLTGYLYGNASSAVTATTVIPVSGTTVPAQAIAALNIDWSTGNMFTKTLSANSTFTFSNAISGQTIVIRLTNTASNYTVTWPGVVKWPVQTSPVMTIGAFSDVYTIIYDGTNYYGSYVQNF
jgi:hypothetical protein